jgi:hypothetical protein
MIRYSLSATFLRKLISAIFIFLVFSFVWIRIEVEWQVEENSISTRIDLLILFYQGPRHFKLLILYPDLYM